jgi:hypothetical protein
MVRYLYFIIIYIFGLSEGIYNFIVIIIVKKNKRKYYLNIIFFNYRKDEEKESIK